MAKRITTLLVAASWFVYRALSGGVAGAKQFVFGPNLAAMQPAQRELYLRQQSDKQQQKLLQRLRAMQPGRAYQAFAEGRTALSNLVGAAGIYTPGQVHTHLQANLIAPAKVGEVLQVPELKAYLQRTLRHRPLDVVYDAAGRPLPHRFAALSPPLLYALARADVVPMAAVVALFGPRELNDHVHQGLLNLAHDPFVDASPAAAFRLHRLGLLSNENLQGRWPLATWQAFCAREKFGRLVDRLAFLQPEEIYGLASSGAIAAELAIRYLPPPLLVQLAETVGVQFEALLRHHLPARDFAQMVPLVAAGSGDWHDWYQAWPHSEADLADAVEVGFIHAGFLRLTSRNTATTAQLLFEAQAIDLATAATAMISCWDGNAPLPLLVRRFVCSHTCLTQLLGTLPMPAPLGPEARQTLRFAALEPKSHALSAQLDRVRQQTSLNTAFMSLCLAVWLEPRAQPEKLSVVGGVKKMLAGWAGTKLGLHNRLLHETQAVRPEPAAATACEACLDTFPAEDMVDLPGCAHPPKFDRECFVRGLTSEGGQRCPDPACRRALTLADALQLQLSQQQTLNVAAHTASLALDAEKAWGACRGANCLNGARMHIATEQPFDCRCCGSQQPLKLLRPPTYNDLSDDERATVTSLVNGACAARAGAVRPIRECYHCGLMTEHQEACMHMICPSPLRNGSQGGCGRHWNFVFGEHGLSQYELGAATYVPKKSWLVALGLYEGLQPGQTQVAVAPVLRRNLARLERARTSR